MVTLSLTTTLILNSILSHRLMAKMSKINSAIGLDKFFHGG
ncbi:hypothetical protein N627_2294 [Levilactobacillus brevis]|nr:hypothetical protein N627_2294 [Levilactobacillus brevis]